MVNVSKKKLVSYLDNVYIFVLHPTQWGLVWNQSLGYRSIWFRDVNDNDKLMRYLNVKLGMTEEVGLQEVGPQEAIPMIQKLVGTSHSLQHSTHAPTVEPRAPSVDGQRERQYD